MLTGNFALLAGIVPASVEAWYLSVYADAHDWVELPNTHGTALYADGGVFATKPYAASGAYIHRMSDYCGDCRNDPKAKLGPTACPFNALYWRFLIVNQRRLRSNPRVALPYRHIERMDPTLRRGLVDQAEAFLDRLEPWDGSICTAMTGL
jgi:deoxyribodipyrimidine photolyase-related protein